MATIQLTEEQCKALLELIDGGLKFHGLRAATAAGFFATILQRAIESAKMPPEAKDEAPQPE